jgi:LPS sulfotransferase NodH
MAWNQYGPPYDFPAHNGPTRHYLLATTPRSGSHFLADLIFQTGGAGCPHEYLNPLHLKAWCELLGTDGDTETLQAIRAKRTAATGVFGLKSHWPHFAKVRARLPGDMTFKHVIYLTRRNKIAQAVSLEIARQTKAWISYHTPSSEPAYSLEAIRTALEMIEAQEAEWERYFALRDAPSAAKSGDVCYASARNRDFAGGQPGHRLRESRRDVKRRIRQ